MASPPQTNRRDQRKTAPNRGTQYAIHDSFSRGNVHVLTNIDYAKMIDAGKAKESGPRTDHDYT